MLLLETRKPTQPCDYRRRRGKRSDFSPVPLPSLQAQLSDTVVRLTSELAGMFREKQNPEEVRHAIRLVNTRLSELSAPLTRDLIRHLITKVDFGRNWMKVVLNPLGLIAENPSCGGFSGQKKPASSCFEVSPVCLLSKVG